MLHRAMRLKADEVGQADQPKPTPPPSNEPPALTLMMGGTVG